MCPRRKSFYSTSQDRLRLARQLSRHEIADWICQFCNRTDFRKLGIVPEGFYLALRVGDTFSKCVREFRQNEIRGHILGNLNTSLNVAKHATAPSEPFSSDVGVDQSITNQFWMGGVPDNTLWDATGDVTGTDEMCPRLSERCPR